MSLKDLLDHQRLFNRQVWDPTNRSEADVVDRLRSLGLGIVEETMEFLRTFEHRTHRKRPDRPMNHAHSHEQLIDMFKYWLSCADIAGFPIDRLEDLYYDKSRVVQYRYQEEWVQEINRPSVVIDIDEVLADYITGICRWAREYGASLMKLSVSQAVRVIHRLNELETSRSYITAGAVGVTIDQWAAVKHDFRIRGGKRRLNPYPDAMPFLRWCRSQGWIIILITSRPVDRYPNIFTDTLAWLMDHHMEFDYLWWSVEKSQRLEESLPARFRPVFAVDDSATFVGQFSARGIPTYWLCRSDPKEGLINVPHNVTIVHSLLDIMEKEKTI